MANTEPSKPAKPRTPTLRPGLARVRGWHEGPLNKVVLPRATHLSLGLKIRAAWEAFERKHPGATEVAEKYGTEGCQISDRVVSEWKATLKKVLGANAPPAVKMKPRGSTCHPWIQNS